jgi:hypothetical protein
LFTTGKHGKKPDGEEHSTDCLKGTVWIIEDNFRKGAYSAMLMIRERKEGDALPIRI